MLGIYQEKCLIEGKKKGKMEKKNLHNAEVITIIKSENLTDMQAANRMLPELLYTFLQTVYF